MSVEESIVEVFKLNGVCWGFTEDGRLFLLPEDMYERLKREFTNERKNN